MCLSRTLHPGAMDKLGFSWDEVHKINPRCIYATIKGFPVSSKYAHPQGLRAGGAGNSRRGFHNRMVGRATTTCPRRAAPPSVTPTPECMSPSVSLPLSCSASTPAKSSFVYQSMHNACLNLCRIKTRDQLTLDKLGYLTQFPQYPDQKFPDFVPRSGNQEGSGVLGWTYKCKGWESDPNAYVYIIFQRGKKDFELACKAFGFEDWLTNPDTSTPPTRVTATNSSL